MKKKVLCFVFLSMLVSSCITVKYTKSTEKKEELAKPAQEGALSGEFSIADGKKVRFSQGNLQYQASTNTWRFSEHQWDIIGEENCNISSTYDGWIDLFGWGTSGYHDTLDPQNVNYQPWSSSNSRKLLKREFNVYGYGPSTNMPSNDLSGTSAKYDWGIYNPISNGGNEAGLWRTMDYEEWAYLMTRETTSGICFAMAQVNNINGLVLLPDDWSKDYYNFKTGSFNKNTINAKQWRILEEHGAVFLPAAGFRRKTTVKKVGRRGNYWSSSPYNQPDGISAYYMLFGNIFFISTARSEGRSVRLVTPIQ